MNVGRSYSYHRSNNVLDDNQIKEKKAHTQEMHQIRFIKSVNLKYITVGRLEDDMIVPPSDGAMFILID